MTERKCIGKMYSEIKAPQSTVEKCVALGKKRRMQSFPAKRTLSIAAALSILLVAVFSVGAYGIYKHFRASDALDNYAKTLPYPEKQGEGYSEIFSSGNEILSTQLSQKCDGLEITPQETYYDGRTVYISFVAKYSGEFSEADRFDYVYDNSHRAFAVDGNDVIPTTNGAFFLLSTEEGFAGVLGLPYASDKEIVDVEICLPYLEASADDAVIGRVQGEFCFELQVKKSVSALTYKGEKSEGEIYIDSVYSTPSALEVVYFVPDEYTLSASENTGVHIMALPVDENGNKLGMIQGEHDDVDGGELHTVRYAATDSRTIDIIMYDKNDACGCGNELCVVKEFGNISLS